MALNKGWEHTITLRGLLVKDELTASATGSEETWYAPWWPITDSSYDVTDDETDVTLRNETDGEDVDSGGFTLDGSEGSIVETGTENKQYVLTAYVSQSIGFCKGLTFDHDNSLKTHYVVGSRAPYEITEHSIKITGKIEMLMIDKRVYTLLSGKDEAGNLHDYSLVFLAKSGGVTYTIAGLKFGKGTISASAEDVIVSNLDWEATSITPS